MTYSEDDETRLERIVDVYDAPDETESRAPSTARTLGAAGVTVAVVTAVLLGASELAAGIVLVALAAAIGVTADEYPGGVRGALGRMGDGSGRLEDVRSRLKKLRPGRGSRWG